MTEAMERVVQTCQEFVRSMYKAEETVSGMPEVLSTEEMRTVLEKVLTWIQETDEIPVNSFTRELAREIIGQLSSILVLKDYQGSPDYYIG